MKDIVIRQERITAEEYTAFLRRTDLGSQYPRERFEERITRLVKNASVSLTARDVDGLLVGICFGITDFAYWLFVTDLGVDRAYTGHGIGGRLLRQCLEAAGGADDIILYTCANSKAIPFYEHMGLTRSADVMEYNHAEWTSFTIE